MIWRVLLRFNIAVAGVFEEDCGVGCARLVGFGVIALELDSSF